MSSNSAKRLALQTLITGIQSLVEDMRVDNSVLLGVEGADEAWDELTDLVLFGLKDQMYRLPKDDIVRLPQLAAMRQVKGVRDVGHVYLLIVEDESWTCIEFDEHGMVVAIHRDFDAADIYGYLTVLCEIIFDDVHNEIISDFEPLTEAEAFGSYFTTQPLDDDTDPDSRPYDAFPEDFESF